MPTRTVAAISAAYTPAMAIKRAAEEFLRRIGDERLRIVPQRSRIEEGHFGEASWGTLHTHEEECSILFGECLAFLQAARARGQEMDADLCEIADALLDEFAKTLTNIEWKRFTVLATEEFFRDLAQIIRLRFPFCGIWDLPVAAHEFGHFIAGRLNVARPDGSHSLAFQEYKKNFKEVHRDDGGDEWMFYLEEYFADVFASFVLGPAYACTCLLLRFDPVSAHSEQDKRHPSYVKRAYAIKKTLLRMNMEKDSKGNFQAATDKLFGIWNQALDSAGQTTVVPQEALIDSFVSSFYEMLKSAAPHARFNCWTVAKQLCQWLRTVPPADVQAGDFKISALLNTAWLCRMELNADASRINDNMIRLCRLHTGGN